jgi:hypothetical protein
MFHLVVWCGVLIITSTHDNRENVDFGAGSLGTHAGGRRSVLATHSRLLDVYFDIH